MHRDWPDWGLWLIYSMYKEDSEGYCVAVEYTNAPWAVIRNDYVDMQSNIRHTLDVNVYMREAHWLVLSPHREKVGLPVWSFAVDRHGIWGLWLFGESKLDVGVNVSVKGWLSLCWPCDTLATCSWCTPPLKTIKGQAIHIVGEWMFTWVVKCIRTI